MLGSMSCLLTNGQAVLGSFQSSEILVYLSWGI